jgi:predicted  nucleic acid-binding Zn-ribbon protein
LASVLQVKRGDWEAFIKEFSELAKKHELLLKRLDLAEAELEAQDQRVRQEVKGSRNAIMRIQSAIDKLCKETERALHATR